MHAALRILAAIVIGLVAVGYLVALLSGALPPNARIDFAAIAFFAISVAAIVVLLSGRSSAVIVDALTRVRAFQFASLKVELETLRARQDDQSSQLELLQLVAPLILSQPERRHLLNLSRGQTSGYVGNHEVRTELRRLRYFGLITTSQPVASAADGSTLDLKDLAQLSILGTKWAQQLEDMDKPRPEA